MASYYQSKKKKPRNKIIAMGPATDDKAAMGKLPPAPDARYPTPREAAAGAPTVNTSGNKRANLTYTPRTVAGGVIHDYPGTKNDVLVKKPSPRATSRTGASTAPSRSLKKKRRITEDDPNWNPYTMGN